MTGSPQLKLKMFHHGNAPLANGLTRAQLLTISDHEFEGNHGFIPWAFPTPYASSTTSNAPVLGVQDAVLLAEAPSVFQFLEDMTERLINFLSRNRQWVRPHDHNHLRVSRAIASIRILHSWELADWFYHQVIGLCGEDLQPVAGAKAHWDAHASKRHDRVAGAFVGCAIGDALGAPVEFSRRGSFELLSGFRAGGRFGLPKGAWTDDTAMSLCLAQSLIDRQGFDADDLLNRFCAWAEYGENTSTGIAVGIGQNTLRSLGEFRRSGRLEALPTGGKSDGNGSLMRNAPIACFWSGDLPAAREAAVAQSRTTHASPLAARCCDVHAELLVHLINGAPYQDAKSRAISRHKGHRIYEDLKRDFRGVLHEEIASTGFVLDTLRAAMWAVENASSFEEAVLPAANLGDDADTVAAVAGQIAGAVYGYASIPASLRYGLVKERELYVTSQFLSA